METLPVALRAALASATLLLAAPATTRALDLSDLPGGIYTI